MKSSVYILPFKAMPVSVGQLRKRPIAGRKKLVVTAAFLNCLPQSGFARSIVCGMRPYGCGSMARTAALVLERAEKVRKAVDLGNAFILMVWSGDLKIDK